MVDEATRKLIFPTPDPFLGEAKKVLGQPGLWGKLGFLPRSFFSLKEKGSDLSQIVLLTEVPEEFEKVLKTLCDTADPFCKEQQKGLGGFWRQKLV